MSPRKSVIFRRKASTTLSESSSKTRPSSIPRRVTTRKSVAPPVAMTTTRVTRSTTASNRIGSPSRRISGSNKENQPIGSTRSRYAGIGSESPGNNRSDGIKKKTFAKPLVKKIRVPLRELTEAEIFERDECVIGDLRHRRVSGGSVGGAGLVVEVDSVPAFPSPSNPNTRHSAHSSMSSQFSAASDDTALTAPDDELIPFAQPKKYEKFTVLRRSDSEENLKATVEGLIASNVAKSTSSKVLRNRTALNVKKPHPALKNSYSPKRAHSPSLTETPGAHSVEPSPILLRPRRSTRASSPTRSPTKDYAGVTKVQASPSPLKVRRVGLGLKSANTTMVMKKVLAEVGTNGKGKSVLGTESTNGNEKPVIKKKVTTTSSGNANKAIMGKGKSSLKRAAGVVGSNSARVGLAGIGRMR